VNYCARISGLSELQPNLPQMNSQEDSDGLDFLPFDRAAAPQLQSLHAASHDPIPARAFPMLFIALRLHHKASSTKSLAHYTHNRLPSLAWPSLVGPGAGVISDAEAVYCTDRGGAQATNEVHDFPRCSEDLMCLSIQPLTLEGGGLAAVGGRLDQGGTPHAILCLNTSGARHLYLARLS
jgi:hypothetical protein